MEPSGLDILPIGLSVRNLRFAYGKIGLLDNISFDLPPGEMVALFGTNGCGKTTLLNCLTGFRRPDGGQVFWNGQADMSSRPEELARHVAFVDADDWEYVPYLAGELIFLGRSPHAGFWGTFSPEDRAKTLAVADQLGLRGLLNRPFLELSSGERQRVKVAMALVSEPRFLLLDEPTSHLDPFHQREVLALLKKLSRDTKLGVLAVLHDINVAHFFDRALLLKNGRMIRNGSPLEVLNPATLDEVYGAGVFSVHSIDGKPFGLLSGV